MSDIDTVLVDSLKALDPKRPIREADVVLNAANGSFVPGSDICSAARKNAYADLRSPHSSGEYQS